MGEGEGKMPSRQPAGLSWEESKERRRDQKPGRRTGSNPERAWLQSRYDALVTFAACGPFCPCVTSNST
jgi:hypothetical protein